MRLPIATAVAIAVGLIILAGYFVVFPLLQDIRTMLIGWGVVLAGVATLVGIFNLLGVHWRKMLARPRRDWYSLALIGAFCVTFITGLVLTPADSEFQKVVTFIQAPVEMSILALLAVSLAFACLRLLQRRQSLMSGVFLISAVIFLIINTGYLSALSQVPGLSELYGLLTRMPLAGARGILLGVALGSLTAGLRVIMGFDRPYRG
ncbi:MAG: hypothetical protein U1B80_08985 [Anaerolineaceae bacterium]|nr:hypothetical protein [Anaerolineaceae bacterium]